MKLRLVTLSLVALAVLPSLVLAQGKLTTPEQEFGHVIGADYELPNYKQLDTWWHKLAKQSDRMRLVEIGKTEEGRTQLMAIVSSPANLKKLDHYREISKKLALAEGVNEKAARALAQEGKAVVWIDGGLHASEVLGAQQLMETLWQMISGNDAETKRILNDVIILFVHANPDGMDLESDWYMRNADSKERTLSGVPRLYQKYIGHDNNRDFYASTQSETKNMNRVMYQQWYPQIVYNHHQTGPSGTVLFCPPFRDPFNYYCDPLVISGIDLVGAAMQGRFIAENKPGATSRTGTLYSTWWNGGLRTTAYFHNMIGLLTETIGGPTPTRIPYVAERQIPKADILDPIEPQVWHFRQSVDYSVTANKAVLDLASRHREQFLFNIWRMGENSIERGSKDSWTNLPSRVTKAETYEDIRKPEQRDPRGYVIPADQVDFLTATKFVQALLDNGVKIQRATAAFTVAGKIYPAGSYVVKAAQAFRPHVLDMFEPQDHPNDFVVPGAAPTPPYDIAGWTLAYQMGVKFDRILEDFTAPTEVLPWTVQPPKGKIEPANRAAGYLLSHQVNDSFLATNRLLKAGERVYWLQGEGVEPGTLFIPAREHTEELVEKLADQVGLNFKAVSVAPVGKALELHPVKVGLWDRYGGSIESGWVRWLLEKFEFPFQVVYAPALDAGGLKQKFDTLVFVDNAIPSGDRRGGGGSGADRDVPAEFANQQGSVTAAKTVPQLKQFMTDGGTVSTIGSSTNLAYQLGLPIESALVETDADGKVKALPQTKFYVPGSLLQVRVDNTRPIAYGIPGQVDVMFDHSPSFKLKGSGEGVDKIAWYDSASPLRSGWAWGASYLKDSIAIAEAPIGKGHLYLFGPEITFRAQPHATFKFLFNSIYLSNATPVVLSRWATP